MLRRSLCAVFVVGFLLVAAGPVMAAPAVVLDGQEISFDVTPVIKDGITMVPLRTIVEQLGAEVYWDDYSKTITALKDDLSLKVQAGNRNAWINGETVTLEAPPEIIYNGSMMIPLKSVSAAFGVSVDWMEWDTEQTPINIIAAPGEEHPVGLNLELTGPLAQYGNSLNKGVQLALKENEDLGLKLVIINCNSNAEQAYEASQRLLKYNIIAQIGPLSSGNVQGCAPLLTAAKTPLLAPAATAPAITVNPDTGEVYHNIFRVCFKDPLQGNLMANFAVKELKAKTCAIIRNNTSDYSNGLTDSFKTSFSAAGGQVVLEDSYEHGDKDFTEILLKLKNQKFDFVYLPGYYQEAGLFIKQARTMGINQPIGGGDGWNAPSIVTLAGAQALNNTYFTDHFSVGDSDKAVVEFADKYKRIYGQLPDMFAALGYDSVMILGEAIRDAQSYNPEDITASLANIKDFTGVTGEMTMGEDHNPIKSGVIMEFKEGQQVFKMRILPD